MTPRPIEGCADLACASPQLIVVWIEAEGPLEMLDKIIAAFPGVRYLEDYRAWVSEADDWDPYGWDHTEHAINADILARTGKDWQDADRLCFGQDPASDGDLVLAPLPWWQAREKEAEALHEQWRQEQLVQQRDRRRGMENQLGLEL